VSCAAGGGCRDDVSFFCPVRMRDSEQLPVAVVGQSGVCSVQCADELNDSRPGTRVAVCGRAKASRGRRGRHALTRTQTTYDSHDDTAKAKDYGARRPDDEGAWEEAVGAWSETRWQTASGSCGGARRQSSPPRVQGSDEQRRRHGRAVSCCVACCVEYSGSYCLALLRCHWYTVIINQPFHLISSLTLTCSRACLDLHSCLPSEHLTSGLM
jgi:hypothetical protein